MILCTWNLNNRVGKVPFRPEAARAAASLNADVLVLTEFYPANREGEFRDCLSAAGWRHQLIPDAPAVRANRVLIASREPLSPLDLELPRFDAQFPANIQGARLPDGMTLVGLRVPAYDGKTPGLMDKAWDWIERTAARLANGPAVMLGDFNTSERARRSPAGPRFRALLASGWQRAAPGGGASYFSPKGLTSEIDHVLFTRSCMVKDARYVLEAGGFRLAGAAGALSDHAALCCAVGPADVVGSVPVRSCFAALFGDPPAQWGLRGDPHLWNEMTVLIGSEPLPGSGEALARRIAAAFEQLVGVPLSSAQDSVLIDRYPSGGMSGGMVDPSFWRDTAIPLLTERAIRLGAF